MEQVARWPSRLAAPVFPDDNLIRYRAQSILTASGTPGPLLPIDQARDVVRWHEQSQAMRRPRGIIQMIRDWMT